MTQDTPRTRTYSPEERRRIGRIRLLLFGLALLCLVGFVGMLPANLRRALPGAVLFLGGGAFLAFLGLSLGGASTGTEPDGAQPAEPEQD